MAEPCLALACHRACLQACMYRVFLPSNKIRILKVILILKSEFETNSNLDKQNQNKTKHMNKMNPKELTSISILIYAGSQYSSLGEAIKNQADIHLSFNDYYETIKGLEACCKVANLLDYKSHLNDLRASMVINHMVCLEEMFLATALAYLSSWTE